MNLSGKIIKILFPIIVIVILSIAYFPGVLEGKQISQHDTEAWKAMSKEITDFRESTNSEAIWTNSMFGGMPGYMISTEYPFNIFSYLQTIIYKLLTTTIFCLFLYQFGFYILLRSMKIAPLLSTVGAIAFGFSSYFLIIISAGHTTKAIALGYLPILIAGVLMVFRGKQIAGAILFAVGLSLVILANHLQITYYGLILIAIYGLVELAFAIKEKAFIPFGKSVLYLLAGVVVAVGMNFSRLYTTWEYSKETIRGPSELSSNNENKTSGLDKDYVVQWSYGISETMTLLIPNFKGGATQINAGVNSKSYEALRDRSIQNPKQVVQSVVMYHGKQPGTSGPVYVGAIVVFLFFLGLFVVKGRYKWWLLIATVVSIVLSWGGNVMGLTSFLLDYLPLYNKFRAPSMILVIAQIAMPLLGFIALNNILTGKLEKKEVLNGLKWAAIISGGLSLIFALLPGLTGDFSSAYDIRLQLPDWLVDAAVSDRQNALRNDAFRSFIFIALAAGALYFWQLKKIKTNTFIAVLGILILVDLWAVDKRYLNDSNFVSKREAQNPFPEMPVDQAILQDKTLSYRVLPLQDPFQDARSSYYHKNVGGYHAAKLRRYQELIDNQILPEMQQMVGGLQAGSQPDSVFQDLSVINMLNTKYVIYDLNSPPIINPRAFGNAWFVNGFKVAENADEENTVLKEINPLDVAVVDRRFSDQIEGKKFVKDKNGSITLTEYQPNYLKYSTKASTEQLAVFSEIYYDKGWNAYIDGKEAPHFRADYVLRGMVLPGGEHTVEFKFHPQSYYTGNKISLASSILLILAVIGFGLTEYRKRVKREPSMKK